MGGAGRVRQPEHLSSVLNDEAIQELMASLTHASAADLGTQLLQALAEARREGDLARVNQVVEGWYHSLMPAEDVESRRLAGPRPDVPVQDVEDHHRRAVT